MARNDLSLRHRLPCSPPTGLLRLVPGYSNNLPHTPSSTSFPAIIFLDNSVTLRYDFSHNDDRRREPSP
jgi:hypothetical protein